MGSMADNHTLGVLDKTDKGYRALVVFARQSNNLLICSKCTYNVNTMTHNTLQIEHYINHMGELDPMINITSLNALNAEGLNICKMCALVFPNIESLLLHCYLSEHTEPSSIYCGICKLFFDNTTTLQHHSARHSSANCTPCKDKIPLFTFLTHYLTPTPHGENELEVLTSNMPLCIKDSLIKARTSPIIETTTPDDLLLYLLDRKTTLKYKAILFLKETFSSYIETQTPDIFPRNVSRLITEESDFTTATTLHALITSMDQKNVGANRLAFLNYRYELVQILLGSELSQLLSLSTPIGPELLKLIFYGPQAGSPVPLIYPLSIPSLSDLYQTYDYTSIDAILIGNTHLRNFGIMDSAYKTTILNLSPGIQTYPITDALKFGGVSLTGLIKLSNMPNIVIWNNVSYFSHVFDIIRSTPNHSLYLLEMDISCIIKQIPNCHLHTFEQDNLHMIIKGYFANLKSIMTELTNIKGSPPQVIIIGQMPFYNDQFSPDKLTKLWRNISAASVVFAHLCKLNFATSYELIGCAMSRRPQIVAENHPIFLNSSKTYSYKTQKQVIVFLQALIKVHKKFQSTCLQPQLPI